MTKRWQGLNSDQKKNQTKKGFPQLAHVVMLWWDILSVSACPKAETKQTLLFHRTVHLALLDDWQPVHLVAFAGVTQVLLLTSMICSVTLGPSHQMPWSTRSAGHFKLGECEGSMGNEESAAGQRACWARRHSWWLTLQHFPSCVCLCVCVSHSLCLCALVVQSHGWD